MMFFLPPYNGDEVLVGANISFSGNDWLEKAAPAAQIMPAAFFLCVADISRRALRARTVRRSYHINV